MTGFSATKNLADPLFIPEIINAAKINNKIRMASFSRFSIQQLALFQISFNIDNLARVTQ
jgi:hypothetical protein